MSRRFANSAADAALELGEAAVNSAVTIAARLPILSGYMVNPTAAGLAEWQNASSEKIAAGVEGVMAACLGWQNLMWRSLLAPINPAHFAEEAMVVARAAIRPAHACVRANAARLGGR